MIQLSLRYPCTHELHVVYTTPLEEGDLAEFATTHSASCSVCSNTPRPIGGDWTAWAITYGNGCQFA